MKDILIPVWVQIIPHVFAVEHAGFEWRQLWPIGSYFTLVHGGEPAAHGPVAAHMNNWYGPIRIFVSQVRVHRVKTKSL